MQRFRVAGWFSSPQRKPHDGAVTWIASGKYSESVSVLWSDFARLASGAPPGRTRLSGLAHLDFRALTPSASGPEMSPIILRCPQHLKNVHGHWEPNIEWLDAKLGIPSAAGFHRILTPTGKLSRSRERYMAELLGRVGAWRTVGHRHRQLPLGAPRHRTRATGPTLVRDGLRMQLRRSVSSGGTKASWLAARPMRSSATPASSSSSARRPLAARALPVVARVNWPVKYHWQVQGQLWASGRAWCDIMSYCPGIPEVVERVRPQGIEALEKNIPVFVAAMLDRREHTTRTGRGP